MLNPSVAPNLSLSVRHNLLRGFGRAMNARNITLSRIGLKTSNLSFKNPVIGTVVRVLNACYALVSDFEDVKAEQSSVDAAQTLFSENKRRVELGADPLLTSVHIVPLDRIVVPERDDTANPHCVGGPGAALGQIFRRNFATESLSAFYQLKLAIRQAKARLEAAASIASFHRSCSKPNHRSSTSTLPPRTT